MHYKMYEKETEGKFFFFIFKVNGQALVSAVQCLPKQKGRYVLVTPAFLLLGFFIRFWKILKDFEIMNSDSFLQMAGTFAKRALDDI